MPGVLAGVHRFAIDAGRFFCYTPDFDTKTGANPCRIGACACYTNAQYQGFGETEVIFFMLFSVMISLPRGMEKMS